MSSKFIQCDRKTPFLLPPSIEEWLPEGHLARFVVEIVGQLNLRSLKAPGNKAMFLSLESLCFMQGIYLYQLIH
jgi:hypothetical protein